jgi:hypothetical protein
MCSVFVFDNSSLDIELQLSQDRYQTRPSPMVKVRPLDPLLHVKARGET